MSRPNWDEYFLRLVEVTGLRATCDRGRSGCLIVKDHRQIAGGYVGAPPGFPHCDEAGHRIFEVTDDLGARRQHCIRTIHAEQNAIIQAAKHGVSVAGATLYCTMEPCRTCAMFIVSVGIVRVVARKLYQAGGEAREMFKTAGIELVVVDPTVQTY